MERQGEFGEPWRRGEGPHDYVQPYTSMYSIFTHNGKAVLREHPYEKSLEMSNRAIACVNALAGLDPEMVAEFLSCSRSEFSCFKQGWEEPTEQ